MGHDRKRKRYVFFGIVQGVGFRPYLFRMARKHKLHGFVRNTPEGVVLEVEGSEGSIVSFFEDVMAHLPPAAEVSRVDSHDLDAVGEETFKIIESDSEGEKEVIISPDIAICDECLRELEDPHDRRYAYPFINCTNCGPRLTIIRDIPYDRPNTSMGCFHLCNDCLSEYMDPVNRRFHAEPNACPICGPRLWLADKDGGEIFYFRNDPIGGAVEKLRKGYCVAVKGLGGFHLAVDATSEDAVRRLRFRKNREEKPFAIMVQDLEMARRIVELSQLEKDTLVSPRRPIVLCGRKDGSFVAPSVAPGVPDLGVMLPYTPLHHLLLKRIGVPLVMTSGNRVDEPICIGNREAISRLRDIADFFLLHNRDILVRCDDSVEAFAGSNKILVRRSRGWAPKPIVLKQSFPSVLALGGHLKSTLCILKDDKAYISPHIGDLETPEARDFFVENIRLMERIAGCSPEFVVCDLHPGYWTTRFAEELPCKGVIHVQHHHAHVVSAMAENGLFGTVIGLAMDGTGYGDDGKIWGGEFLVADCARYKRVGHISSFCLPGAERAVKEPWRCALGVLHESFEQDWQNVVRRLKLVNSDLDLNVFDRMMRSRFNAPETTSLGRLFDAVAAVVGIRKTMTFEGQAAMELQSLVKPGVTKRYPFNVVIDDADRKILDIRPLIRALAEDVLLGEDPSIVVSAFHLTLVDAFIAMAKIIRDVTGISTVVLSGGCFQNKILLGEMVEILRRCYFEVHTNRDVPINDGGISFGQAVVGASILKKRDLFA
ncbi:MAG: carbamoyltransferase HypF [Syntrophales bacterium]|nr:carbamoyltransferase HypF [Syntrophales bacterium]